MNRDSIYYKQVALLMRLIPLIEHEKGFALKGGTAINLFVQNLPRLSVDIYLAYLPFEPRSVALGNIRALLCKVAESINDIPELSATLQDIKRLHIYNKACLRKKGRLPKNNSYNDSE